MNFFWNTLQDNGLVDVLYKNDWLMLPQYLQKVIFSYLIQNQQNAPGFPVGPFRADLSREIFMA